MSKFLRHSKNILVIFLVLSFAFTPFFGAFEYAQAQSGGIMGGSAQSGGYTSGGAYGGAGINGYIKGLGVAITQLPGCKKKIKGAMTKLFKNTASAKSVLALKGGSIAGSTGGLTKDLGVSKFKTDSIPTNNKPLEDAVMSLKADTNEIKASTASLDENETCLDGIAKMVIKLLLQKITVSTVAWIQSGFDGKPAFVQNPGNFFRDIAKDEILQFAGEIKGNPYSASFLQSQAAAFNNKFAQNAQYSLNELIKNTTPQYSAVSFNSNFSFGGWSAWTFMTQVPANNPLGFQVMASNELSKRLDGTFKSNASNLREDLTRAAGYLGDLRCANPEGLTKQAHQTALAANFPELTYEDANGDPVPNGIPTGYIVGTCRRWEYVTPGKMIAESATKIVNYPDNNYLKADDLNDAVAAILDALLARFSADLMQKGFADFSNEGSNGAFIMNFGESNGNGGGYTQTEKDYPESLLSSSWLIENPDFNIRTDITQAMIDEQRIFITKLEEQNVAIDHIIKTTRQLDYCIPGPNPDWESESSVEEFYQSIKVTPKGELPALAQLALSFDPTGIISGIANAIFNNDQEKELKRQIARYLQSTYDVHIYGGVGSDDDQQDQVVDESGIRSVIENTFETYRQAIYKIYFAGSKSHAPMPQVTSEARAMYDEISGYEQMIANNEEEIPLRKGIVTRLAQIKEAVEALNLQYNGISPANPNIPPDENSPGYYQYENELKDWIYYFGRLTKDMVTGNDIAKVDNVLKDIIGQDEYIYDNLLKGPGGCEKELEDLYVSDPIKYSKYVRRQPYPLPIYYLYGNPVKPASADPNNPPPNTNNTKYFGPNASNPYLLGGGNGGTWVGDGTAGTWWTGTSGNGMMIFNGLSGTGTWTGAGISGTWNVIGSGNPNGPIPAGSTWTGTSGQGNYTGSCTSGVCSGTWGGGNGSGINGGGYAPASGVAYGSIGINQMSVSGQWTLANGGVGIWTGSVILGVNNNAAVGTWQVSGNGGGVQLNSGIGQWKPGSPPANGGNNPPANNGCVDGPCQKIAWNENDVKNWDPNQGFMYGMVYTNSWAGPYTPANLADLCEDEFFYELFPNYVEISLPGGGKPNDPVPDIGGLETEGVDIMVYNGSGSKLLPSNYHLEHKYENTCGVITRQFEKIFKIY